MKRSLFIFAALVPFLAYPLSAEDTLAQWAAQIDQRDVQQKILSRIFGGDIGPVSNAILNKETGIYLFPKSGSWVRLGQDSVYGTVGGQPYLVVTSVLYNDANKSPVNTSAYLLKDTSSRPRAISGGYANRGRVQKVDLPAVRKSFLVLVSLSSGRGGGDQWGACLLEISPDSIRGNPRNVWNSPNSARDFQFGFDKLGGEAERLVLRVKKGGDIQYSAYRWNGDRFETDSFASESRIKALPDDVWRFGALQ